MQNLEAGGYLRLEASTSVSATSCDLSSGKPNSSFILWAAVELTCQVRDWCLKYPAVRESVLILLHLD